MVIHSDPFCVKPVAIAIADDSPVMREGLASLIADECDLAVTASAATAVELRDVVVRHSPRVLVMELMLGESDGLALIRDLLHLVPALRIVVFTRQPADIYATRCLQAGAAAFIGKTEAVTTLFRAIRQAAEGVTVFSPTPGRALLPPARETEPAAGGVASFLSNRELQVFRLAGRAMPTRAIAQELGVSIKTVESHRENIKNKLGLDSHAELVACAAQWLQESGTD